MAHFMGAIKTGVKRLKIMGYKLSGVDAEVYGWRSGVLVQGRYNEETRRNEYQVFVTGGRKGAPRKVLIAEFSEGDRVEGENLAPAKTGRGKVQLSERTVIALKKENKLLKDREAQLTQELVEEKTGQGKGKPDKTIVENPQETSLEA